MTQSQIIEMLLLAGWAFEVEGGRRDEAVEATGAALEALIAEGLGFTVCADQRRLFDPVEVVNFIKWTGLTGRNPFWAERFVKTGRQLAMEFLETDDRAPFVGADGRRRFHMVLRRTFDLTGIAAGVKLRLRAPRPIACQSVQDIDIRPIVPESAAGSLTVRDDSIEVRWTAGSEPSVTIGGLYAFTATHASSTPADLSDDQVALYLRRAEGVVRVTARVQALAERLSPQASTQEGLVAVFFTYLIDHLICGAVRYDSVPPDAAGDWVLDGGWYDCQLGSALLVSLCRAMGLPARLVSGHLLYRRAPTNHYWAEVWITGKGWAAYDFLAWDLSEGGLRSAWRDVFAGQVDFRAVTQILPLRFTGPMSISFPAGWQMLQVAAGGGVDIGYTALDGGGLIYRDHVDIKDPNLEGGLL